MTILLRLAAPAQSWGTTASAKHRTTAALVTRSGIEGLFRAALGIRRGDEPPAWLGELEILARADRPGNLMVDLHTVSAVPDDVAASRSRQRAIRGLRFTRGDFQVATADGSPWLRHDSARTTETYMTYRSYIADGEFILAVEGDGEEELWAALRNPVFPLYLGRKACIPGFPLLLGRMEQPAASALRALPSASQGPLPTYRIRPDRNELLETVTVPTTTSPLTDWRTLCLS